MASLCLKHGWEIDFYKNKKKEKNNFIEDENIDFLSDRLALTYNQNNIMSINL